MSQGWERTKTLQLGHVVQSIEVEVERLQSMKVLQALPGVNKCVRHVVGTQAV